MQPGLGYGLAHGPAELHDHRLPSLFQRIKPAHDQNGHNHYEGNDHYLEMFFHCLPPSGTGLTPDSSESHGTRAFCSASTI